MKQRIECPVWRQQSIYNEEFCTQEEKHKKIKGHCCKTDEENGMEKCLITKNELPLSYIPTCLVSSHSFILVDIMLNDKTSIKDQDKNFSCGTARSATL